MSAPKPFKIRRIAIIGAGPSGLATAKYLLAERSFPQVDIFEQRGTIGGIWNFSPEIPSYSTLPQISPYIPVEKPQQRADGEAIFPSPMYEGLETNIPHELMKYSDLPFSIEVPLFPPYEVVKEYLEEYANDIRHLIHFSTQVLDVRPLDSRNSDEGNYHEIWRVKTRKSGTQLEDVRDYDAVVVAGGNFDVPYVPDICGLAEWNEHYPGIATHSKAYRKPDYFKGKKVIIVGNSASGLDIGNQIATACAHPLLESQRSPPSSIPSGLGTTVWKEELPEITAFLPPSDGIRAVRFANDNIETEIDAVVFCTGYLYSHPYLSSLKPSPDTPDGSRVQHVYRHIFFSPRPTLAFVGLPREVVPFQIAESQSAVIARVWSNRIPLPSKAEMDRWEIEEIASKGTVSRFHRMGYPTEADYINEMHTWCLQAIPRIEGEKLPPLWGGREKWFRAEFRAMRKAYSNRKMARHRVKRPEDLGFSYKKWKEGGEQAARSLPQEPYEKGIDP
ncbi:hypothetical protein FGG08_005779 [Glutinoglossum americanum]|uniref:Flavin-containing monooxygenase n=1 Tax=Glutinoglossum americanum TaxID=1670608 RepID=A0A9P8KY64_9PEZI|nr:hypothetical protein FGG08_005779 [Glutinoglossum americanum]